MAVEPTEDILSVKIDTKLASKKMLIVSLTGILNTFSSINLVKLLTSEILDDFKTIIFDFENLKFVDSMGISAVITIYKRVVSNDGKLIVMNAKNSVKVIFDITNISQKIPMVDSIDEVINIAEGMRNENN
jgi:anti-sigma B factor antagonist